MDRHTIVLEKYSKLQDQKKKEKNRPCLVPEKKLKLTAEEHLVIELNTDQIKIRF